MASWPRQTERSLSSAGRALRSHRRGRWFESSSDHHFSTTEVPPCPTGPFRVNPGRPCFFWLVHSPHPPTSMARARRVDCGHEIECGPVLPVSPSGSGQDRGSPGGCRREGDRDGEGRWPDTSVRTLQPPDLRAGAGIQGVGSSRARGHPGRGVARTGQKADSDAPPCAAVVIWPLRRDKGKQRADPTNSLWPFVPPGGTNADRDEGRRAGVDLLPGWEGTVGAPMVAGSPARRSWSHLGPELAFLARHMAWSAAFIRAAGELASRG